MKQNMLVENQKTDDFVKSLELTPEKIKQDMEKMKTIEGFPNGDDEDILELSNPPYYTSYPNPYIVKFIQQFGKPYDPQTDSYKKEPFVGDISESKNDRLSTAHEYVTKVPYKAIMYFVLHYTDPGDIVFDGFCGTGMTGVAAQMCKNPDNVFKEKANTRINQISYGSRKAILSDLATIASFISSNYNTTVDPNHLTDVANKVLQLADDECSWMFQTKHITGKMAKINHIIWSDNYVCPLCGFQFDLWNAAINKETKKLDDEFVCPGCKTRVVKDNCKRAVEQYYDDILCKEHNRVIETPVMISYAIGGKKFTKIPDKYDLDLIKKIQETKIPYWFPSNKLPAGYNTNQPIRSHYLTHTHHFYYKRNLYVLSKIFDLINKESFVNEKPEFVNKLRFIFT